MAQSSQPSIRWDAFWNIVNGERRSSDTYHQGVSPSTGDSLWKVPVATQQDLNDVVHAGQVAFEKFRCTALEDCKVLLAKFRDRLQAEAESMTDLLCVETGKPGHIAEWDTRDSAEWFDHHLSLTLPTELVEDDEKIIRTRYMPLGVVGAICPWNFPLLLSLGKIIPALLTGNTIIVKPSPFTPYTTLKMVELAQAMFEPGVIQVVGSNDALGPMMMAHPGIAKTSFTGSTLTGKKIMSACANTVKRITLELGGNDAAIVLPDVDVKAVAPKVIMGAFQNSGQICVGTKRIYIHTDIYDDMLREMIDFTSSIKVGAPDSGAAVGPVQNRMQYERVKEFFEDTKAKGYKIATADSGPVSEPGFLVSPTIVDNPPDDSFIVVEEPFGPIVPTLRWIDEEEVVQRANDTTTGLGASVWSRDISHAEEIGCRLECGSVWINSHGSPTPSAYFSGHEESGIGGEWGTEGLKAYCNTHVTHIYKDRAHV